LFPLQAVLFPGGLLTLKVFEARYLDLVGACLREAQPFGVVALRQGGEVMQRGASVAFEPIGTLAELIDVDAIQPGILGVRCRGTHRFETQAPRQQANGLWVADTTPLADDDSVAPPADRQATVDALERAIEGLREQGAPVFLEPYRFDDAGWVANRWCEILPISLSAKQKLLELDDPHMRLTLVDEYLRGKGVVV
jgi:Lon protease-like protein